MASDSDDRTGETNRKPMAVWASELNRASSELARAMHRHGTASLEDHERNAVDLVQWFADLFAEGRIAQPLEIETLSRLAAALKPDSRDRRIALAVERVAYQAERFQQAKRGDLGNTPEEIGRHLTIELWGLVDERFEQLEKRSMAVLELLGEYKADSGRRTPDGRGAGKMSAARILEELNTLAGHPLGERLDAHAVSNAMSRWKKQIPSSGT